MLKPSQEKIAALNAGLVEAKNLMETLAVDIPTLLTNILPQAELADDFKALGITKKMHTAAQCINKTYGWQAFSILEKHTSDTLRSIACYLITEQNFSLARKLELIKPLADDSNSGVREWAWLAVRPSICTEPLQAIALLTPWCSSPSENIRRFASESTRPRGVWCQHSALLKAEPWLAKPILTSLNNDPSRYVQKSVANWLNDASKDQPLWVKKLCAQRQEQPQTVATQYIIKRALRTLAKKQVPD
jgi:3-methyladenine DNA glycosylase AlkC